jgi:DNA polymerase-3 subunit chi
MKNNLKVSFYHLVTTTLEETLSKILLKILNQHEKSVILFRNDDRMLSVDKYLWSFSSTHIIPHGTCYDDYKDQQPIYLTTKIENPNKARILIVTDVSLDLIYDDFSHVIFMFDGNTENELDTARTKWHKLKENYSELSYYKQDTSGAWQKV